VHTRVGALAAPALAARKGITKANLAASIATYLAAKQAVQAQLTKQATHG